MKAPTLKFIFQRLGLPKHSDIVYRTIEKHAPILASHIVEKSSLHRPAVYGILEALAKHRFIYTVPAGKRKHYHAASPQLIAREFSLASEKITEKLAEKTVAKESLIQKELRFLHGREGIREAFDDVISHTPRGETFYRYTSEKDLDQVNAYLSKNYRERRDKKKLERLVISNPQSGARKKSRLERFIKFIPKEASLFDQNIIQLVYGDRIALIDITEESVVIIENRALAEFQKVIFRQLYRKL